MDDRLKPRNTATFSNFAGAILRQAVQKFCALVAMKAYVKTFDILPSSKIEAGRKSCFRISQASYIKTKV